MVFLYIMKLKLIMIFLLSFLTAQSDEFSIITGLDLGADDYISKPFQPRILLSRIQNILRRYKKQDQIFQYQKVSSLDKSLRQKSLKIIRKSFYQL